MTGLPVVAVKIGFGQTIATGRDSVTWTDVTGYVRAGAGVQFNRGRAEAGSAPTAGTCTVTFANDGRFTAGRSGGPYGAITTGVPVRITADAGMGPRDLWWGFVTDWSWTAEGEIRAECSASDILATAARTLCLAWHRGRHINAPGGGPVGYWPLSDSAEAEAAASGLLSGGRTATRLTGGDGAVEFGVGSDLPPDPDVTVAAFVPASAVDAAWLQSTVTAAVAADLGLSAWVMPTSIPASGVNVAWLRDPVSGHIPLLLQVTSTGRVHVGEHAGTLTAATYGPAGVVPVGRWSHLYVEVDRSVTSSFDARFRVWVDGVEQVLTGGSSAVAAATRSTATVTATAGVLYRNPFEGQLAHVAMWDRLAAADGIPAWLADARGQTAAQRVEDLAFLTASPAAFASWLDGGDSETVISPQPTVQVSVFDLIQQVADTIGGAMIAARDGRLTLQSSTARVHSAPVVSLSAATEVLALNGAFTLDDVDLVQAVEVTAQPSGAVYRATRAGAASGVGAVPVDIWTDDAAHAAAMAHQIVNRDSVQPRAPQLVVSVDKVAHLGREVVGGAPGGLFDDAFAVEFTGEDFGGSSVLDALLRLEVGDLIEVTDLPAAAPAAALSLVVESIGHDIAANGWTVTVDTSPGVTAVGWLLGDPVLSVLGSTTIPRV